MPNPIKYSTSAQTLALKKGNFWIGTGDVGKGPTSTTDYYNGITPPAGGYTIYVNKGTNGPAIFTAPNDAALISLTNRISYITTNYISNGGNFNNGTISPFIYDYSGAGGVARVVSIANDKPYVGSTSTNALELNYNGGRSMDTTGLLTVGQTYTFSFWAKVTSGSSFAIGWNNQNGSGETNSWSSGGFTVTTSWQRYSQVFTYDAARTTFFFSTRNQTVGTLAIFTEFQLSLGSAPCGPGLTTAAESINWFLAQTDKMVFNVDYPAIVTDGLVLNYDAGFTPSITSLPTNIVGNSYGSYTIPWYDVSTNGISGSLQNGPTFNTANLGSVIFDGSDDYVNSGYDLSWNNTNSVTIDFWANPSTISGGNYGIMGKVYPEWEWAFYQNNTNINLVYWNSAGGHTNGMDFSANVFSAANTWYNITYTWNGSVSTFYLNGSYSSSKTADNPSINQNRANNVMLGGHTYVWADSFWSGKLGAVRFYNRALSTQEITQNHNAQKSRFGL